MRYRFIQKEKASYPLTVLCRCLQVARSGYYQWQAQKPSKRALTNQRLIQQIQTIYKQSKKTYGSPRIWVELRSQGEQVGKNRVARLQKEAGLCAWQKPKGYKTTDSKHPFSMAPNVLNRQFTVEAQNQGWVTDTTYLWTQQGWLYLAVILDLYSRKVVGWATSQSHDRALVLDALQQALCTRQPKGPLLHHSDRGSLYASHAYQERLRADHILCSMSRKGNCWDNAVAESFFATLKRELIRNIRWSSREQVKHALFEWIEIFYNRQRRHSFLDYQSPVAYEQTQTRRSLGAST